MHSNFDSVEVEISTQMTVVSCSKIKILGDFPGGSVLRVHLAMQVTWVQSLYSRGGKDPLEKEWQPTPVFLPGNSHGQRSQVGYSPWWCKRAGQDWVTEHTHTQSTDRTGVWKKCKMCKKFPLCSSYTFLFHRHKLWNYSRLPDTWGTWVDIASTKSLF